MTPVTALVRLSGFLTVRVVREFFRFRTAGGLWWLVAVNSCAALLFAPIRGYGADWDIRPSVSVNELYSDNIRLRVPGAEDAAVVSTLMPGLDLHHDASRFKVDLRYRMQNLFYAGSDAPANRIQNFLQANSTAEIISDNLYLSSQANVGRLIASTNGVFSPNTIYAAGNTTDFQSVRLNPYWRGRIKDYSDGLVGFSYAHVSTGAASTSGTGSGTIGLGDSNVLEEYANFQSGSDLSAVTWRTNFANSEFDSSNGQDATLASNSVYRAVNGELRYHFLEDYSAFVRAGNFDNKLAGINGGAGGVNNGAYWTVGGSWTPSPKTAVQGGWGENNYLAAAEWQPSRRTSLQVVYRNSRVGGSFGGSGGSYGGGSSGGGSYVSQVYYPLADGRNPGINPPANRDGKGAAPLAPSDSSIPEADVGYAAPSVSPYNQLGGFNSGTTWNALFRHSTQRSVWCGSYTEVAQPFQTGLLYQSSSCSPPLLGGVLTSLQPGGVNPAQQGGVNPLLPNGGITSQLGSFDISQPSLTNQIISRKRGEVSMAATTGKSDLGLYGYQENRTYQPSRNGQDVLGAAAYWEWKFARRTSTLLRVQWQQIRNSDVNPLLNSRNNFVWAALMLRRELSRDLEAVVGYQYLQQTSNVSSNEYFQNGVWAALSLHY